METDRSREEVQSSDKLYYLSPFLSNGLLESISAMAVKIRFARHGCTHRPFYRIVVANSQSPRDGRFIQIIGFYDPLAAKDDTKKMGLNYDRAKYWLSVGAQPSDTVRRILMQAGLIEPPPMVVMANKDGNKDEA